MENVFQNYEKQLYRDKELIIILNKDDMDRRIWEARAKQSTNVTVYQLPEQTTLGECMNYGVLQAKYSTIAKFDDDDYYGKPYLAQAMTAMKKTGADIVGKTSVFMYFEQEKLLAINRPGNEHRFMKYGLKGATLVFKKEVAENVEFPHIDLGEDTYFLKGCVREGYRLYSTDKYHYACIRKNQSGHHTWDVKQDILLRESAILGRIEDEKRLIRIFRGSV